MLKSTRQSQSDYEKSQSLQIKLLAFELKLSNTINLNPKIIARKKSQKTSKNSETEFHKLLGILFFHPYL